MKETLIKFEDETMSIIDEYKKLYKARTGKFISRSAIVAELIAEGLDGLKAKIEKLKDWDSEVESN